MPEPMRLLPLLSTAAAQTQRPPLFRGLDIAITGLSAQRMRMETIATNIANAETTRGPDGQPYKRRMVQLEAATALGAPPSYPPLPLDQQKDGVAAPDPSAPLGGVQVVGISEDQSEGPLVYDPGHPDANAQGYVEMPNVNPVTEMVDLISASRAYEANVTAMQTAKTMFAKTLELLR
jgi:flagellar basal-body rod protein FlgC